jgi:hypothetical protein
VIAAEKVGATDEALVEFDVEAVAALVQPR